MQPIATTKSGLLKTYLRELLSMNPIFLWGVGEKNGKISKVSLKVCMLKDIGGLRLIDIHGISTKLAIKLIFRAHIFRTNGLLLFFFKIHLFFLADRKS